MSMNKIVLFFFLLCSPILSQSQDLENTCWEATIDGDTVVILLTEDIFTVVFEGDTVPISSFMTSGDTLRMIDIDIEESECDSTGTYSFTIMNNELDFTLIDDQCDSRAEFMGGLIFYSCGTLTSNKNISEDAVKIYPNPVQDHFIIDTNISFDKILLLDQQGRLIITVRNKQRVEMSSLEGNLFFLQCIYGDQMLTKKILKR